jgi:Cu2+-exporting ATPase
VWSGNVTDITPETARLLSIGLGAIALTRAAYAGRPFFASAWRALKSRLAQYGRTASRRVILALGMSLVETAQSRRARLFDSAIMLLFFLLVGRPSIMHARKTGRWQAFGSSESRDAHRLYRR